MTCVEPPVGDVFRDIGQVQADAGLVGRRCVARSFSAFLFLQALDKHIECVATPPHCLVRYSKLLTP